nr:MAG TPA: hypothetical protein [Caudoviricetes sp.]
MSLSKWSNEESNSLSFHYTTNDRASCLRGVREQARFFRRALYEYQITKKHHRLISEV